MIKRNTKRFIILTVLALAMILITPIFHSNANSATDYSGGILDGVEASLVTNTTVVNKYFTVTDNNESTYVTSYPAGDSRGNNVMFNFNSLDIGAFRLKADLSKYVVKFWHSDGTVTELNNTKVANNGTLNSVDISDVVGVGIINTNSTSGKVFEFNLYTAFPTSTPEPTIEPSPTPSIPTENGRAILVVTMTTGLEKEFDLSLQEVNDFINWYELKQAGSGKASYAINKHDNNKGPFKSRKDYILFDRILTFEVSEY